MASGAKLHQRPVACLAFSQLKLAALCVGDIPRNYYSGHDNAVHDNRARARREPSFPKLRQHDSRLSAPRWSAIEYAVERVKQFRARSRHREIDDTRTQNVVRLCARWHAVDVQNVPKPIYQQQRVRYRIRQRPPQLQPRHLLATDRRVRAHIRHFCSLYSRARAQRAALAARCAQTNYSSIE